MHRWVMLVVLLIPFISFAEIEVRKSGHSIQYIETQNFSAPQTYIVELSTRPLIESRGVDNRNILEEEHSRVRSALLSQGDISIRYEYRFVFNGFAVKAPLLKKSWIENISGVIKVTESQKVSIPPAPQMVETQKMLLDDSVALIGGTELHQKGIRGAGKIVAILDTGIDKTHPAFSQPEKIIYTHNVFSGGTDVTDGHGHGTHCAGIAAGNGGEIVGVAPDAKLAVIKVLNDGGGGGAEGIIDGMEHAADMDQDPSTIDPVDVISMSLGTPGAGDPEGPMAQTVDRLSAAGIVFTIAAGNSGLNGIGSPGVAEKAITVGASTKYDTMAGFSSIGPVEKSFALKPEIIAPGVLIKSSLPGNSYQAWSGTSMATPHVAGAAALLLEQHPQWSPEEVKNALMVTAKRLNRVSSFSQGWGRVRLVEASSPILSIDPYFEYLGVFSEDKGTKQVERELVFRNLSEVEQVVEIEEKKPIEGISWTLPPKVAVSPGENISIPVTIEINSEILSFPNSDRMAHEPLLAIKVDGKKHVIPIYLVRGIPVTLIATERSMIQIASLEGSFYRSVYFPPGGEVHFVLPAARYVGTGSSFDIGGKDYYFVRDVVDIDRENRVIDLSLERATNTITLDHRDLKGDPCKRGKGWIGVYQVFDYKGFSKSFSSTSGLVNSTRFVHLSPGDFDFSLSSKCDLGKNYTIIARAPGKVTGDETVSTPEEMIPLKVNVNPIYKSDKFWISETHCHFFGCVGDFSHPTTLTDVETIWFDGNPMNIKWYIVKDRNTWRETSQFYVDRDGWAHFGGHNYYHRTVPMETLNFGFPSITWQGMFENRSDMITMRNPDYIMNPFIFLDASWIRLVDYFKYQLTDGDGEVTEGVLKYVPDEGILRYAVPTKEGPQELVLHSPFVETPDGNAQLLIKTKFDTLREDPNPPMVRNLEVLNNNTPAYEIEKNTPIFVKFEAFDRESAIYSVECLVKHSLDEEWTPIYMDSVPGNIYVGSILLSSPGLHDLLIRVKDTEGNITELTQLAGTKVLGEEE
ncbi:S8 family serine peptidase [Bdellovibrionota bacterium]